MSKDFVDKMIHNMKLAGMVTKAAPWMVEGLSADRQGFGDAQMNVRYVGIAVKDDWLAIFPTGNNLLIKFIIDRTSARLEFYVANKPPFFRFTTKHFTDHDKWETLLGDIKQKLKRDKADFQNHRDGVGNFYALIKPHLK